MNVSLWVGVRDGYVWEINKIKRIVQIINDLGFSSVNVIHISYSTLSLYIIIYKSYILVFI